MILSLGSKLSSIKSNNTGYFFQPRPLFFTNSLKAGATRRSNPFFFTSKHFKSTTQGYKGDGSKSIVSLVTNGSPLDRYDQLIKMGEIQNDDHQRKVVQLLDNLYKSTLSYSPPLIEMKTIITRKKREHKGFFSWLRSSEKDDIEETVSRGKIQEPVTNAPLGLYLYGDVGCGKTFLMDLFYSSCSHITRKRRVHFHNFMVEVHDRIHIWRQNKIKERKEREGGVKRLTKTIQDLDYEARERESDPIPPLADEFANQSFLICFDEFQVTDIADAMILYRLFDCLFQRGVILVTTSNRVPDDLYKGGLQRSSFIPCINLIKKKTIVYNINSGIDYRLTGSVSTQVYFYPLNEETKKSIDTLFESFTLNQKIEPINLHVHGRTITIDEATSNGIAKASFNELCAQPLGAADYIALSRKFHTLFLYDIPKMTVQNKSEAKRFIVLIDALYEHQCKLICSADAKASEIFTHNPMETKKGESNELLDSLNIVAAKTEDITIFSGDEEFFQFQRAVSRLSEMQTMEYLQKGREYEKV